MRDSKPQRCVQQEKSLKVTRNATHKNKHINEASKQILPTVSSKCHIVHARYAFQLEDLLHCLQYTNLRQMFVKFEQNNETV